MAYSVDLRQRVVDAVKKAEKSKDEIARLFSLSVPTINRWLKRKTLKADKPGPTGSRAIDPEKLKEEVAANPDAYLDELAQTLGTSSSTVSYTLKKLNITRKKNHAIRRKRPGKAQDISAGSGSA